MRADAFEAIRAAYPENAPLEIIGPDGLIDWKHPYVKAIRKRLWVLDQSVSDGFSALWTAAETTVKCRYVRRVEPEEGETQELAQARQDVYSAMIAAMTARGEVVEGKEEALQLVARALARGILAQNSQALSTFMQILGVIPRGTAARRVESTPGAIIQIMEKE